MIIRSTHLSLTVTETPTEMAAQAALVLEQQCADALKERQTFNLAISGGKTPVELFRLLTSPAWKTRLDWEKTSIYWVDERCVSPDDPQSNYLVARRYLLSHVPVTRFYRMKGEIDPVRAAKEYEATLKEHFNLADGEFPRFDCVLLGLGDDGHTGSLFPDSPALSEKKRMVIDQYIHSIKSSRITMTFPVLNNARCCIFLASGKPKHHVLSTALNLMEDPVLPAQMVRPHNGRLCWFIDSAAYYG